MVSRNIKDITAPKAPKLKFSDSETTLYVKGELGSKIYFKGENGWSYDSLVTTNDWNGIELCYYGYCEYFKVYLKDGSGNKSKVVKIKNPNSGPVPMPTM